MSSHLFGFPNKKERDDFLIAIAVILLFVWLFWYMLMGRQKPDLNNMVPVVEIVEEDSDNDGILDIDDKCPNLKGNKVNNGCPYDTDDDGIYDDDDNCPEIAGVVANNGCPADTDGDGVYDVNDACPEIRFVSESGCPPDTDADGVFDRDDECPYVKGTADNNGCPFNKREVSLLENLQSIQFATGKSSLLADSKVKLDKVVELMRRNAAASLFIEGHTDSTGTASKNLTLSIARANACRDYIVSKGISKDRLRADGFGSTKPIIGIPTSDGRNKRVIFRPF